MKADSLSTLTYLLKNGNIENDLLENLLSIVLILFNEKNKEVYKALLKYLKIHIKIVKKDLLGEHL
jgi:hypothetical protein